MARLVVRAEQQYVFGVVLRPKDARPFHAQVQHPTYHAFNNTTSNREMLLVRVAVIEPSHRSIAKQIISFATPIFPTLALTKLLHFVHE